MIHFRALIFSLIEEGKNDEEIVIALYERTRMILTIPRIENVREAYNKLDAIRRQMYIEGKLNLLGDKS